MNLLGERSETAHDRSGRDDERQSDAPGNTTVPISGSRPDGAVPAANAEDDQHEEGDDEAGGQSRSELTRLEEDFERVQVR